MKKALIIAAISVATTASQAHEPDPSAWAAAPPPAVEQLELQDVHYAPKGAHGPDAIGRLPSGPFVDLDFTWRGELTELEVDGRGALPIDVLAKVLPAAVLQAPDFPRDGRIQKVELKDGGRVEIRGFSNGGREIKAEFASDGRVLELKLD